MEAESESKWVDRDLEGLADYTVRLIVSKVVEVGIRTVMRNHVYKAEGTWRLQNDGGSIGLRLTGEVAKVVMDHWFAEMRVRMSRADFKTYFSIKYVDD